MPVPEAKELQGPGHLPDMALPPSRPRLQDHIRRPGLLLAAILFLFSAGLAKTGPSGIIRVICIGESYYPETPMPLIMQSDPKVQYNPLPANMGESTFTWGGPSALRKFVRIYIPRRYEDFLAAYDLVILSDYPSFFLEPQHYEWFERAIREEGAGLAKYELNFGTGGSSYPMDPWRASAVYAAFPATLEDRLLPTTGPGGAGRPPDGVEVEEGNPLVDLPGVDRYSLFGTGMFGVEVPKPGARTVAWFRFTDIEAIIIWEYGKGRSASTLAGLDWMDYFAVRSWDFYPDFFLNQFYWLTGEEIPEDVVLVNEVRRGLRDLQIRTQLILSVIDFIEAFGASGQELERDLARVEDARGEIRELYLDQEYLAAAQMIAETLSFTRSIEEKSVSLKNRALFWIYVIEYLVISGASLACGIALYTLMVRRKMYREVSATRLSLEIEG